MRKYIIYDSTGTKVAILTTLKDALDFKHIRGNNAWTIKIIEPVKNKKSTERQKAAAAAQRMADESCQGQRRIDCTKK